MLPICDSALEVLDLFLFLYVVSFEEGLFEAGVLFVFSEPPPFPCVFLLLGSLLRGQHYRALASTGFRMGFFDEGIGFSSKTVPWDS